MRTRTPSIQDNGHTWRTDKDAWDRAKKLTPMFKLRPSDVEASIRDHGFFEVFPLDIMHVLKPSNTEMLSDLSREGRRYQIASVLDKSESNSLSELFDSDHADAERHSLGQPWLNHTNMNRMVLTSRITGSNAVQGLVVYDRKTIISMEDREFEYRYVVELANFYVSPDARLSGVGYSLATAAALDIRDDVDRVKTNFMRAKELFPGKVKLGFEIGGDAYTSGGARLARQVTAAFRSQIEHAFTRREIDRYMIEGPLEEDFSAGYAFDDALGEPPEFYDSEVAGWRDGKPTEGPLRRW